MTTDITKIERLIAYEKRALSFQWRVFIVIVLFALALLILNFLMGWFKDFGATIGNIFFGLLSYIPLSQVSKRKDHVEALKILKEELAILNVNDPESIKIKDTVMLRIQKMLEG